MTAFFETVSFFHISGGHWEKRKQIYIMTLVHLFSIYMTSIHPRHLPDTLRHHPDTTQTPQTSTNCLCSDTQASQASPDIRHPDTPQPQTPTDTQKSAPKMSKKTVLRMASGYIPNSSQINYDQFSPVQILPSPI